MSEINAIQTREDKIRALTSFGYTPEELQVITNTVARGTTFSELYMFLSVASGMGLNPFARQIHFVKRAGKVSIQVGIDGFRAIADRTGQYAGSDEPVFEYEEGNPYPIKATVTVYRLVNGQRVPFTRSAYWSEYYPGDGKEGFMWRKMPHTMLAKCAEALALRVAFPAQLSGAYVHEEMHQSGMAVEVQETDPTHVEIEAEAVETEIGGGAEEEADDGVDGDGPAPKHSERLRQLLNSAMAAGDMHLWRSMHQKEVEALDDAERAELESWIEELGSKA